MEGMEIEGKNINEAIEKACKEFQVPREKLNIEIIAEGNAGFLGMGTKKALIRARLLSIDMTLDDVFSVKEQEMPTPSQTKKHGVSHAERMPVGNGDAGKKMPPTASAPKARPIMLLQPSPRRSRRR
jgi:spoIIIJ-associated protein